jgi:2-polyprenyl-3-methyl-5-hydroxy-6-metoxy-1,4-benzoquinol methylase
VPVASIAPVPATDPESYYQDFSLQVGLRDWVVPNARHEQLKLLLGPLVGPAQDLRILDVGCGAGVMTEALTAFGDVTGTDFSVPAIELARRMVPAARFHAGDLGGVGGGPFDLVTMFDVVEHIPPPQRTAFFAQARALLAPGGRMIISTPHPSFTRWLHAERSDLLQVVDEPVEPAELLATAERLGLELRRYETYDIQFASPEYQLAELGPQGTGHAPAVPRASLRRRLWLHTNLPARLLRRLRLAPRVARGGRPGDAAAFVAGRSEPLARAARGGRS